MWKTVLAGTTALLIAGGSLAVAQSGARTDGPRNQPTAENVGARIDARVAHIKARLRLTAEQEKHWPAVEAAIRDLAKERAARMSERRALRDSTTAARPSVIERMRLRAEAMSVRAASLKKLADATEPLYNSLDDAQKPRLAALLRVSGPAAMAERGGRGQRFSEGRRSDRRGHHGPQHGHRGHYGYDGYPGNRDRDAR
jgi:zinc resistance-associated protein